MGYSSSRLIGTLAATLWLVVGADSLSAQDLESVKHSGLRDLVSAMAGSFSSREQAAADSNYFDIRLRMAPIWTERDDAYWLYVEQAMAGKEDQPYRQRVYRVSHLADDLYQSAVYTIRSPLRFAGAWGERIPLAALIPDSLLEKDGCSIILRRRVDGSFAGGTLGRECGSELRGAAFATSEVVITSDRLVSWDRGFDDSGRQVWGAERGGYIFDRLEDWSQRHPMLDPARAGDR